MVELGSVVGVRHTPSRWRLQCDKLPARKGRNLDSGKGVQRPEESKIDPPRLLWYTPLVKTEPDKIMPEAMGLPTPLRAFLAAKLIESLDADGAAELFPAWKAEGSGRGQRSLWVVRRF
jgi:hypothetical protein